MTRSLLTQNQTLEIFSSRLIFLRIWNAAMNSDFECLMNWMRFGIFFINSAIICWSNLIFSAQSFDTLCRLHWKPRDNRRNLPVVRDRLQHSETQVRQIMKREVWGLKRTNSLSPFFATCFRVAFDEDRIPRLADDRSVLEDIHSVSSLLKMYFRELPNPICTYYLYDKFVQAAKARWWFHNVPYTLMPLLHK